MTNRIEIVDSEADADSADAVVCMRLTQPLLMPDNLIDICSKCFAAIQHRPHVSKRPPKICWQCAEPVALAKAAKGELVTMITPTTAAEISAYLRKKQAN